MNWIYALSRGGNAWIQLRRSQTCLFSLSSSLKSLEFSQVCILNTALLSDCDVPNEKLSSHLSSIGTPVWHQPSLIVTASRDLFVFLISIEQHWSTLNNVEQRWTILINVDQLWTTLINIEQAELYFVGCYGAWFGSILASALLKWRKA